MKSVSTKNCPLSFQQRQKKKNLSVETEQENIDKNAQNTDSLVEFMLGNDSYKEYIQTKK